MVIGYMIICKTCESKLLLKITLGREREEKFTFKCTECEEDISVGLLEEGFSCIQNCRIPDDEDDTPEVKQIMLNPAFGTLYKTGEPGVSGNASLSNVIEMARMMKSLGSNANDTIAKHRQNYDNSNSDLMRFYMKICSLHNNNKIDHANKYIERSQYLIKEETGKSKNFYFSKLLNHIIGEYGLGIYNSLIEENKKATNISDLINFSKIQNIDNFQIFEDFLNLYGEFSQVFTYLNNGIGISENINVTSEAFNLTKKYYGSAYEALAKMLFIVAGINNSIVRGDPNKFERLDSLEAYNKSGNGNKLNCIQNNSNLYVLKSCYDNYLRNASFHNHMNFDHKNSRIKYIKNDDSNAEISYKKYLIMCVKITEALAALNLFMIEKLE